MAWHCCGATRDVPYHNHGDALALVRYCDGISVALQWHRHASAMTLRWQCHSNRQCTGTAIALPGYCHGTEMAPFIRIRTLI